MVNRIETVKNILIVEDDAHLRDALEEIFSEGYRPVTAEDALETLEFLASIPIDLIIVYILMPHMDGPELIKRVRQSAEWNAIPILVLSAYADLDRCRHLSVQGFQLKPFDMFELLDTVRQLIRPAGARVTSGYSKRAPRPREPRICAR